MLKMLIQFLSMLSAGEGLFGKNLSYTDKSNIKFQRLQSWNAL